MYYFNGNLMYDLDELKILVDDYIQSGLDMESESYKKIVQATPRASQEDRKKMWKYMDKRIKEEKDNGKEFKKTKFGSKNIIEMIVGILFILGVIFAVKAFF